MESAYEFDLLSELPPLPQEYVPMEYSTDCTYAMTPLDSLAPFPSSDFTPYGGFSFSDPHQSFPHLQNHVSDLSFLESCLSLLTRHSTRLDQLFADDLQATPFLHLPDLRSFENTSAEAAVEDSEPPFLSLAPPLPVPSHDEKRRRRGSVVKSTFAIPPSPPSSSSKSRYPAPSSSFSQSTYSSDWRKRTSDKIRSLEKLMPWEKKMSLATILEETHKYIAFLQSQIASLRWMPLESVYNTTTTVAGEVGGADPLKSLTRQQILQVLANSPGSRTELYSRGVCVFSYEQLLSVKMMAQSARNL